MPYSLMARFVIMPGKTRIVFLVCSLLTAAI